MAEQMVQPQVGNVVVERAFSVGGNDKAKNPLPEMRFTASIVFKDISEVKDCAAKYVVWLAQNKVRVAAVKKEPIPYPMNRKFTMDASAKTTLTSEERNQQALERLLSNPDMLQSATPAQRTALLRMLNLSEASPAVEQQGEPGETPEPVEFDEDELAKLPMKRLQQLAEKHELEDWEEMTKGELVENLASM